MFTMRPEIKFGRTEISRRAVLLGLGQAGVLAIIGSRLRYLQVSESEKLTGLADQNRINIRLLIPERGLIFDRNGVLVAGNEKQFNIVMITEHADIAETTIKRLQQIISLSDDQLSNIREQLENRSQHVPVVILEEAGWEEIARVSANAPVLPGVQAEVGDHRIYPMGPDLAHLIGYVGKVSQEDLSNPNDNDLLLKVPDFKIGKSGVEVSHEKSLRGRAGNQRIEVNAYGRVVRELEVSGAQLGMSHQLTIDTRLQNFAAARLANQPASAVVMDVKNGDILSMVSSPTFDPNQFVSGISHEEFNLLLDDPNTPLVNRPVQGIYPPGSTFKMITALAALEAGVITPDELVNCRGSIEVSGRNFHCWKSGGHQNVNLEKSIIESCDVYYFTIAQMVGIEKIRLMAQRFGIGIRPTLSLPGVSSGLFPTQDWKLNHHETPWVIGDTLNTGIGQGFLLTSSLQLALMTSRLATGLNVQPRLVLAVDGNRTENSQFRPMNVSSENMELLRNAMVSAVNKKTGTAYASRILDDSFTIAGKSGTSQVRNISQIERQQGVIKNEDLELKDRDHALFCCFAPSDNPVYAATVIVEHGGSGSAIAAPIARDLLLYARYKNVPPLSIYPPEVRNDAREIFNNLNLLDSFPTNPVARRTRA